MLKTRNEYIDILRGIAIIMVIAIHTFNLRNGSDIELILRNAINCSVPIFLAISGYIFANKSFPTFSDYMHFEKKQILRVYIPLLVFSSYYFFLSIRSEGNIFYNLIKMGSGYYGIYYFIPLIIQFYLLLPILQKFNTKKSLIVSFFITMFFLFFHCYIGFGNIKLPLLFSGGPFVIWLIYFMIGLYLGKKGNTLNIKKTFLFILLLLFLFFEFVENKCIISSSGKLEGFGVLKISSVFYSSSVILFLFKLKESYKTSLIGRCFANVGLYSFGIYFSHIIFINIIRKIYPDIYQELSWGIKTFLILFISYRSCVCISKIAPKFSRTFLGIK